MKKLMSLSCLFLSAISSYAIDPHGSRVDYGGSGSGGGGGAVFMVILGIILLIIYYFLSKSGKPSSGPQNASQSANEAESVQAQIARWEQEHRQRKKREAQETKGCIVGIIIFVLVVILCMIFND